MLLVTTQHLAAWATRFEGDPYHWGDRYELAMELVALGKLDDKQPDHAERYMEAAWVRYMRHERRAAALRQGRVGPNWRDPSDDGSMREECRRNQRGIPVTYRRPVSTARDRESGRRVARAALRCIKGRPPEYIWLRFALGMSVKQVWRATGISSWWATQKRIKAALAMARDTGEWPG